MSEHTPGPWVYTMYKDSGWDFKVTANHGKTVIVGGCGCCDSPWVSSEADARLIAAAPELLEALELALGSHNRFLMSDPPKDAWVANGVEAKARAAIAKARGEDQ